MFPPTSPDETPTLVFNPSKNDFVHQWDGKDYFMPSRKIVTFPKWLADHMAKNLARKLALEDDDKGHFEDKLKKWTEKIFVKL